MDAGIGIGGLSVGMDEFASSSFDMFSNPEIENGIKKTCHLQSFISVHYQVRCLNIITDIMGNICMPYL